MEGEMETQASVGDWERGGVAEEEGDALWYKQQERRAREQGES